MTTDHPEIRNRIIDYRNIPATDLQDNLGNWREHPQIQRGSLRNLLYKIGIAGALTAYHSERNNGALTLINGHLRKDDYSHLDWPVLILDVNDDEADALLATLDPLSAMATTNQARLTTLRESLKDKFQDLQTTLDQVTQQAGLPPEPPILPQAPDPQIDRAEELREIWGVELGQLWSLGEHRLICGDCTDRAVVERVMGQEKANMVFTDPPYNEIDKEWDTTLDWNLISDIWKGYSFGSTHLVLFGKVRFLLDAHDGLKNNWVFRMEEIWHKPQSGSPGNKKRFLQVHENIWWFKRRNNNNLYFDIEAVKVTGDPYRRVRKSSTVVDYANQNYVMVNEDGARWPLSVIECNQPRFSDESEAHPTQKPVEVISRGVMAGTRKDDLVYDPFLGSGTTLIACENLGRLFRGCEISEAYTAVVLQRFLDHTGRMPKLIG